MKIISVSKRALSIASIAIAAVALVGCAPAAPVAPTVTDAWVKAVPELMDDMAMTGVFMNIENSENEEIFLTSATSDTEGLTETPLEIHETVQNDAGEMVMQEAQGGIAIPAQGMAELKPGGNHVMLWDLIKPIPVGSTIELTLSFSNGSSVKVKAVAREIANAQEKYTPEEDMDMGE